MSFEFRDLKIDKLAVIGSGQIGPDIALHFAKVLHPHGVRIVVVDVVEEALERGRSKLHRKVDKGVETGAFSPDMARAMKDSVEFTTDYGKTEGAQFAIEAASENLEIKKKIFAQLEQLCAREAVLASNSSHLQPEVIFENLSDRSRALVIHYFFPAERNPMVEIVPGKDTDKKLVHLLMSMYEHIGKIPIRVGSRYGYAIDPVFEGLFLASALCVQEGLGSVKEVDWVAREALGLTVGSFTAMNLTGGNPLTDHGLEMEGKYLSPWFHSPRLMKEAIESGKPWDVAKRGEKVEVPEDRARAITEALQGAYFGLAGQILDSGIVELSDLEMGLEIALDINPPFEMMNRMGVRRALELVEKYAASHPDFKVPECLRRAAAENKPFRIDYLRRHDLGDVAWVRIRRPKVLNALNQTVYDQLTEMFEGLKKEQNIKAVVLSGYGVKAFVSGADINFLSELKTPEEAFEQTQRSKRAGLAIEALGKPVVAALNGLALGGGLELALCCSDIIVTEGLKIAAGLPEVNLGIIPGSGGTQRLPRWIGVEEASRMMRTGKPVDSARGVELGLFSEQVPRTELIERAARRARDIASGKVRARHPGPDPIEVPEKLPEVDLGHLSRAIDRILCRAITEGCKKPLPEGLEFESRMFAECMKTKDMRIGLENFLKNGPRAKAEFVHE